MSFANFNKFKELHPEAKNPRNSVAGIINGKELVDEPTYRVNVKNSVDQSNEKINAIKEVIKWLKIWKIGWKPHEVYLDM